jgi:hypothetical protein
MVIDLIGLGYGGNCPRIETTQDQPQVSPAVSDARTYAMHARAKGYKVMVVPENEFL